MATRFFDGKDFLEIEMKVWDGEQYGTGWENDFFEVGGLKFDEDREAYIVDDVEYLIDNALDWKYGCGDYVDDCEGAVGHNPYDRAVYVNGFYATREG